MDCPKSIYAICSSGQNVEDKKLMMTKVQVKKSLLQSIGNAKQCVVCRKIFSRETDAVAHVYVSHSDILHTGE